MCNYSTWSIGPWMMSKYTPICAPHPLNTTKDKRARWSLALVSVQIRAYIFTALFCLGVNAHFYIYDVAKAPCRNYQKLVFSDTNPEAGASRLASIHGYINRMARKTLGQKWAGAPSIWAPGIKAKLNTWSYATWVLSVKCRENP